MKLRVVFYGEYISHLKVISKVGEGDKGLENFIGETSLPLGQIVGNTNKR